MRERFEGGMLPVVEQDEKLEKEDPKDYVDVLQEYLQLAAIMYDELSSWQSKGDKKLKSLVQDVHEEGDSDTDEEITLKTASLKLCVGEAVNLLGNLVKKIFKFEGISRVLEDKLGKKIGSLEEAKITAQELIRPFYEQYSRHLRANGNKGKRTRDVMSSDQAAWDISSKAVPSDLDIMDDESFQAFQEQRKKFQDMLEKLVFLPGPHQKFAKLLAEGQGNSQDVNLLLNSYASTGGKSTNRFKKLDVEYNKQDLKNLEVLINETSRLIEEIQQKLGIEIPSKPEGINVEKAIEILGSEKVFGPEDVSQVWGVDLERVPIIPFSLEDLEKAKALGMYLILRIDKDGRGRQLTGQMMNELKQTEFTSQGKGKILHDPEDWYIDEAFFIEEKPKLSWALTSGDVLRGSTSNNYLHQTRLLRDHLKTHDFLSQEEEEECSDDTLRQLSEQMGVDWNSQEITDPNKYNNNWQDVSKKMSDLLINQNHRQSFAEALYDFISLLLSKNKRILIDNYNWTKSHSSSGDLVGIGDCVGYGASVSWWLPEYYDDLMGVSFSC
ncbi:MAG: hypothetical protein A2493_03565 [Candidatus Magasanikbacteria bacterium RIFOXYC12_FULL_33_11]|uniref:Uncharacterized protein n=1 Tax=Candidatus Magasanikbacteria bacterium RIFOXYC12_FULL_33_11 TaxID=1798701 RepID=A0A1F6NQR6_9BACT|nr:MAG: hypothetical protein A2493_03565 [Candidatus Magasanikbacteria bacterium RIFOXYC12_FULL_33_11]